MEHVVAAQQVVRGSMRFFALLDRFLAVIISAGLVLVLPLSLLLQLQSDTAEKENAGPK